MAYFELPCVQLVVRLDLRHADRVDPLQFDPRPLLFGRLDGRLPRPLCFLKALHLAGPYPGA